MSHAIIKKLLDCLPDNGTHPDDPSWTWGWDELSGEAQDEVQAVRQEATQLLLDEILKEANTPAKHFGELGML